MIITKTDVAEFSFAIESISRRRRTGENIYGAYFDGHESELEFNAWLSVNPQVLMAGANLQEFLGSHKLPLYRKLIKRGVIVGMRRPAFRSFDGQWLITSVIESGQVQGYSVDALKYAITHAGEDDEYDYLINSSRLNVASLDHVVARASKFVDGALLDPTTFVSPKLWTPGNQDAEKLLIQRAAVPLIRALQAERVELQSLHWKQLEVIVAEILRECGMEVHMVRESPQGGRDIIGRMQIAPGEILTIAVEIKHERRVDRPILHTALHQNAQFPALMLVTSGRFSAGVIREAQKPENRLRLFLKDGVAIRDLIRNYSGLPTSTGRN